MFVARLSGCRVPFKSFGGLGFGGPSTLRDVRRDLKKGPFIFFPLYNPHYMVPIHLSSHCITLLGGSWY